jgi:hypothetical protein
MGRSTTRASIVLAQPWAVEIQASLQAGSFHVWRDAVAAGRHPPRHSGLKAGPGREFDFEALDELALRKLFAPPAPP